MAEERSQPSVQPPAAPAEEVVAVPPAKDGPPTETKAPSTVAEKSDEAAATAPATETEAPAEAASGPTEEVPVPESSSFKEESNRASDLPDPEKKALDEFKALVQKALQNHEFTPPPPPPKPEEKKPDAPPPAEEKPASEAPATEPPAAAVEEPPKEESEPAPAAVAEGEKPPEATEAPPPPAVEVVEETEKVAGDKDGAKIVETIEETVVAATTVAPETEVPAEVAEPSASAEPAPAPAELESAPEVGPAPAEPEKISIWGVELLADERSDVVLLKFLRARDFKVKDAFTMLKNTIQWRKEFGIDGLLEEDLGHDLDKVVFMHGFDKEGHPVCYNVYEEFEDKELYQKTLSDEEKRQKFLRWRIQFLEKGIKQLDFNPGGVCTLVQVNDLRNSPVLGKRELKQATNQALILLQDNYPEFVARQIFINVPWWYLAFYKMISPFLTQRTKSKFVFASAAKSTETLFKYIAPEQVPVQYGGLTDNPDFGTTDPITEVTIRPTAKRTIEIPTCLVVWELRVPGWDVSSSAEFVPSAEDGYTVIIQKTRKLVATDEPVLKNTFKLLYVFRGVIFSTLSGAVGGVEILIEILFCPEQQAHLGLICRLLLLPFKYALANGRAHACAIGNME
ncbi:hypothetical protein ACLOJK_001113 [Asimina triloba]